MSRFSLHKLSWIGFTACVVSIVFFSTRQFNKRGTESAEEKKHKTGPVRQQLTDSTIHQASQTMDLEELKRQSPKTLSRKLTDSFARKELATTDIELMALTYSLKHHRCV